MHMIFFAKNFPAFVLCKTVKLFFDQISFLFLFFCVYVIFLREQYKTIKAQNQFESIDTVLLKFT